MKGAFVPGEGGEEASTRLLFGRTAAATETFAAWESRPIASPSSEGMSIACDNGTDMHLMDCEREEVYVRAFEMAKSVS